MSLTRKLKDHRDLIIWCVFLILVGVFCVLYYVYTNERDWSVNLATEIFSIIITVFLVDIFIIRRVENRKWEKAHHVLSKRLERIINQYVTIIRSGFGFRPDEISKITLNEPIIHKKLIENAENRIVIGELEDTNHEKLIKFAENKLLSLFDDDKNVDDKSRRWKIMESKIDSVCLEIIKLQDQAEKTFSLFDLQLSYESYGILIDIVTEFDNIQNKLETLNKQNFATPEIRKEVFTDSVKKNMQNILVNLLELDEKIRKQI